MFFSTLVKDLKVDVLEYTVDYISPDYIGNADVFVL